MTKDVYKRQVLGWEPYDFGVQEMNFHFIQPIGEDILLLGSRSRCYRDGSVDQNAVVVEDVYKRQWL